MLALSVVTNNTPPHYGGNNFLCYHWFPITYSSSDCLWNQIRIHFCSPPTIGHQLGLYLIKSRQWNPRITTTNHLLSHLQLAIIYSVFYPCKHQYIPPHFWWLDCPTNFQYLLFFQPQNQIIQRIRPVRQSSKTAPTWCCWWNIFPKPPNQVYWSP